MIKSNECIDGTIGAHDATFRPAADAVEWGISDFA
jgi:hypothetical protein